MLRCNASPPQIMESGVTSVRTLVKTLPPYRCMCRGTKTGLVRSGLNLRLGDLAGQVLLVYPIAPRSSPKTACWKPGTFAKRGLRAVRQMSQECGNAHHLGALTGFPCPSFAAPLTSHYGANLSDSARRACPATTQQPAHKAAGYDAPGYNPAQSRRSR
jgi:hypothetical protein